MNKTNAPLKISSPSIGKWRNKLWYNHAMEYSLVRRNGLLNHEKTWKNLKFILLNERSQSEKATYHVISTNWHSGKRQYYIGSKKKFGGFQGIKRDEQVQLRRIFVRLPVLYYNGGYMA